MLLRESAVSLTTNIACYCYEEIYGLTSLLRQ